MKFFCLFLTVISSVFADDPTQFNFRSGSEFSLNVTTVREFLETHFSPLQAGDMSFDSVRENEHYKISTSYSAKVEVSTNTSIVIKILSRTKYSWRGEPGRIKLIEEVNFSDAQKVVVQAAIDYPAFSDINSRILQGRDPDMLNACLDFLRVNLPEGASRWSFSRQEGNALSFVAI